MVHGRRTALLALVAGVALSHALSAAEITSADEYNKKLKQYQTISPGGDTPFGEQINLYSGELSFRQTDITFAGTGPLISITRSTVTSMEDRSTDVLAFGEWDSSIPRMEALVYNTSHWPTTGSCTNTVGGFTGLTMVTDDGQRRPVLKRTPEYATKPTMTWTPPGQSNPVPVVFTALTNDNWQLGCLPGAAKNGGEGFLAVSPEGTKYFFTHLVYSKADTLFERDNDATIRTFRKFASLHATRIEDRFGNSVTFKFNAANARQLDEISASDGRRLTFAWRTDVPVISAITKHGDAGVTRTWQYQYAINGTMAHLASVVLPDSSTWQYSANVGTVYKLTSAQLTATGTSCAVRSDVNLDRAGPYVATVTSPSGAIGTFELAGVWHGRSYVPSACMPEGYEGVPSMFGAVALTKRTIGGPGLTPQVWTYAYSPGQSSALRDACAQAGTCPDTAWTQVVDPGGNLTRHTYSTRFGVGEGRSLKVETFQGTATPLRTESYSYANPTQGPWPARIGISLDDITTPVAKQEQWAPMNGRTITQQGVTFTWSAIFDEFAKPTVERRESGTGTGKFDSTFYYHDLPRWILGQVQRTVSMQFGASNEFEVTRTEFENALPVRMWQYGKLKQTITYDVQGNVSSVSDGRDSPSYNTTIQFNDWYRGIPRHIGFPDGRSRWAEVNALGLITSTLDELYYKTCYAFDAMDRLARIEYPNDALGADGLQACGTDRWNPLERTFAPVATTEYGLAPGHWKETIKSGLGYQVNYFDALWRPVVAEKYDANDVGNTWSQSVTRYDGNGQVAFASYPMVGSHALDFATVAAGTRTQYDALGRATRVEQDSELGVLATATEYLGGFQARVTNPRGKSTTTAYKAYDQPTTDWPIWIRHEEGAYTDIDRDLFGKPRSMRRSDASASTASQRSYSYNAHQELCHTVEPETNAAFFGYDAAGNLAWSSSGHTGAQGWLSCDQAQVDPVVTGKRTVRTYDNRNRITRLDFPTAWDDRGDQVIAYTEDGRVARKETFNGSGVTIVNAYSYDKRRHLVGESLAHANWYTWSLGYGYDSNGALAALIHPGWEQIDFAPNALGQHTQVASNFGTYATGAKYFPNGALKQFTYGNGIVHTLAQNLRQLPDRSRDASGSVVALDDSYDYDGNANVAAISDGVAGARGNRTMTYDGLDRLTGVTSPMFGNASYGYDVLDNLTRVGIGGPKARDHWYCYDGNQRLTNIKTGGCGGTSVIGLGYDALGNLANKNGVTFDFDEGNRLRCAGSGAGSDCYRYDGEGRRVLQSSSTAGNILSMYGQDGVIRYVENARNQTAYNYFYLAGSLVGIRETAFGTSNNTFKYQHTDALGTPVAVSNAAGQVIERSEYEPFGEVLNRSRKDGPGYTGHVEDRDTGLVYMQQRYYDPLGRFLSVDPVTAYGGDMRLFNRYAYANNSPYKFIDPDGRLFWLAPVVFAAGALLHSERANAPAPGERTEGSSPGDALAAIPGGKLVTTAKTTVKFADKVYGNGARFTRAQKRDLLKENRERNGGDLRSDKSGTLLEPAQQSQKGVTPSKNEAHVDHVVPRSAGGTNDPKNAQVLSREENLKKSNK